MARSLRLALLFPVLVALPGCPAPLRPDPNLLPPTDWRPEEHYSINTLEPLAPTEPGSKDGPTGAARMRVHLIDIGQGAATLLEFSCAAVLVDTGGETNEEFDSGAALRRYLDA